MTPSEFKLWRKRHRLTQPEAGELLGLTRQTIAGYERDTKTDGTETIVPRHIALACAAIAHGLGPWEPEDKDIHHGTEIYRDI